MGVVREKTGETTATLVETATPLNQSATLPALAASPASPASAATASAVNNNEHSE